MLKPLKVTRLDWARSQTTPKTAVPLLRNEVHTHTHAYYAHTTRILRAYYAHTTRIPDGRSLDVRWTRVLCFPKVKTGKNHLPTDVRWTLDGRSTDAIDAHLDHRGSHKEVVFSGDRCSPMTDLKGFLQILGGRVQEMAQV